MASADSPISCSPGSETLTSGYMGTSINDGPGCLMLRCPDPSCVAAVGQDMINKLSTGDDKEKYSRYLVRSYIEDNRKTKWCPAPGCEFAVEFVLGSGSYDDCCNCSYNFCWNCTKEAHRPVDCGTVAKWILKNSAESENMNWILANSMPCPKCKRPIEKNQGCMHITCTPPCKYEFCWLCLGIWSEHGERTGGFYACNRYEAAKQYDESERRREMAKNSLERCTHYYERWATNQSSRQKALVDLLSMQTEKVCILWVTNSQVATSSKPGSSKSLVGGKTKMGVAAASSRSGGGPSRSSDDNWACEHCTFVNLKPTNTCQLDLFYKTTFTNHDSLALCCLQS